MKKKQFAFWSHVFEAGNRRRDRCQYSQGRYGGKARDDSIPVLEFGQLDGFQYTVGKLWRILQMILAKMEETQDL